MGMPFFGYIILVGLGFRICYSFPTEISPGVSVTKRVHQLTCPEGCHVSCRGASGTTPFCYCRCKPPTVDYGSLVYAAVVEDIWQVRCGYLDHPFTATALAMNISGLLDEFAATRCHSDYTDECRSGQHSDICSQWWAVALCRDTCARHQSGDADGTTTLNSLVDTSFSESDFGGLCPPDIYFRSHRPSFGNPYTGCADLQRECGGLYGRGYCQLRPATMNCQETCGRCVGDDSHMPWNPIRSQLIQWALNRGDDGTARTLMNYFMRQYADYISEVHRSCSEEASSLESAHRKATQESATLDLNE